MRGPARGRVGAAAWMAAAAATLALGACGDDETTTGGADIETWTADAESLCGDGIEEATALPLPGRKREIAADARARAEILVSTRDGLTDLGTPEGIDGDALSAYLDELDADIEQLEATAESSGAGSEPLDESAGQAALELGLDECAALANAIARTP